MASILIFLPPRFRIQIKTCEAKYFYVPMYYLFQKLYHFGNSTIPLHKQVVTYYLPTSDVSILVRVPSIGNQLTTKLLFTVLSTSSSIFGLSKIGFSGQTSHKLCLCCLLGRRSLKTKKNALVQSLIEKNSNSNSAELSQVEQS